MSKVETSDPVSAYLYYTLQNELNSSESRILKKNGNGSIVQKGVKLGRGCSIAVSGVKRFEIKISFVITLKGIKIQ